MRWVWLIFLAAPVWGGSLRSVPGKNWDKSDAAAVNVNFQKVDQALGNTVTKTGTQTIVGEKSFSKVSVTTATVSSATITALTATAISATTVTASTVTATAFVGGSVVSDYALGMKNLIINGDMRIDQRNFGAAVTISTSAFPYSVDRFFGAAGGAAVTHQRVASGITGFPYALRMTGSAGNTSCDIVQRIESSNIAHADSGKITFSFYAAHSAGGSVVVLLQEPTAADNYTAVNVGYSQTFTLTSALTRYAYTTTLSTSAVHGLQVRMYDATGLGAGETLTTTGWQVELGDTATAFEYRPRPLELMMCQRYYYRAGYGASGNATDTTVIAVGTTHPTTMRGTPTMALIKTSIQIRTDGSASQTGSSCALADAAADTKGWFIRMSGFSGLTARDTIIQMHDSDWLGLNAEL